MTTEAFTTKLARERLAAIKKFIPVRDKVRNKLQRRQEIQTDFSIGSESFSPYNDCYQRCENLNRTCDLWGKGPNETNPIN